MDIHTWWRDDPNQRYWVEITGRKDIGQNLKAPQTNEAGGSYWGYSLINYIADADVVFHYNRRTQSFEGCSKCVGAVWEAQTIWAARGSSAREQAVEPHPRPGWYLGLEAFTPLADSLTLDALRSREPAIREVRKDVEKRYRGNLYFPFALSSKRPLRVTQGYIAKFPRELLSLLPELRAAVESSGVVSPRLVGEYREADEEASVVDQDPFTRDPALVERALKGHAKTQNALASVIRSIGWTPASPVAGDPNFDLAWESSDAVWVAEIKSMTSSNEERQLRLGLGQILRFRDLLKAEGQRVHAVLAVEREPTDSRWKSLCASLSVELMWPEVFSDRLKAKKSP